jgi:ribokinase
MRAAVVGHTEWIWFAAVDRIPGAGEIAHATAEWEEPGGGGAVAAVQLAKLAGRCDFFTATGEDDIAGRTLVRLTELGVTVHAARRTSPSRRALTQIDGDGERTITTLGERLAPSVNDPLPWDRLDGCDAVYVTAGDAGAFARARDATTMVVTARVLDELVAGGVRADALVGSARDPAERVEVGALPWRPALVVRTDGRSGGTFETADGRSGRYEPAPASERLVTSASRGDAYGAGDSFAAGLTYALGSGMSVERALEVAARCGAACASARGPYAGQLTSPL